VRARLATVLMSQMINRAERDLGRAIGKCMRIAISRSKMTSRPNYSKDNGKARTRSLSANRRKEIA
jgi:hypothetical protein